MLRTQWAPSPACGGGTQEPVERNAGSRPSLMRWRMIVGQKSLHTLIHIARAHMPFAMLRRSSNVSAVALALVLGVADTFKERGQDNALVAPIAT